MPPKSTDKKEEKEVFMNIVENAVSQVDFRQGSQVGGAMEYVLVEVLVSYIIRYFIKSEKRSILELLAIHAGSIPFIGGLAGFVDANHPLGYEAPIGEQFSAGSKGIPAVFLSEYIVNTAMAGFHIPKVGFKDILVTAASKTITRPLVSVLYPYISDMLRNNLDVLEEVFRRQRENSNLASKPKKADDA